MDLTTQTEADDQGPKLVGRVMPRLMDDAALALEANQGPAALAHVELVAEIKSAFQRTGRPVPQNLEAIAHLARLHRLEPIGVLVGMGSVEDSYHDFLDARAELADPSLIVARLRRKAAYRAEAASRHAVEAEEYESKADMARAGTGWHGMTEEFAGRAAAAHRCAERLMAEAKAMSADADLIEREGLGAFTAKQREAA
jgi:hypothetical protein